MSLRVQGNVDAFAAARALSRSSARAEATTERLSSGLRINRAADDAAGLGMSERLRAQARGLGQAQRNIADAISLVQTAEGALGEAHSAFQRIRELTIQFKNGTLPISDKIEVRKEMQALYDGMMEMGRTVNFNGIALGTGATVTFQVGASDGEQIGVRMLDLVGLATDTYVIVSPTIIQLFDNKINAISVARGELGAVQNRLEHALASAGTYEENLTAADSRIRDADFGREVVELTRHQILGRSAQAMLAQSMQSPRRVLDLLAA